MTVLLSQSGYQQYRHRRAANNLMADAAKKHLTALLNISSLLKFRGWGADSQLANPTRPAVLWILL